VRLHELDASARAGYAHGGLGTVKEVAMRSGRKLSALGIAAGGLVILGPLLAYLGVVRPLAGFALFALGGIIAVVLALAAVIRLVRGRGLTVGSVTSLVVAAIFVGLIVSKSDHPRINDFTTDVEDPPALQFAATLPENQGRDMSYPPAFAAVQQQCCGDLKSVEVRQPQAAALERARRLAAAQPSWRVTHSDPLAGTVEAVATSNLFHFHDDIVIRVRAKGGDTSIVDMRSKSRDGQGDMGVNAARIRKFLVAFRTADGTP
jgi:uncharacterized protein (DUF1499 family)